VLDERAEGIERVPGELGRPVLQVVGVGLHLLGEDRVDAGLGDRYIPVAGSLSTRVSQRSSNSGASHGFRWAGWAWACSRWRRYSWTPW
jgi:hypothetical protein